MKDVEADLHGKSSLKQLSRTIEDLSATGQALFQALVALQRRRHDTQRQYTEWYANYVSERARVSSLAAELEKEVLKERELREDAMAEAVRANEEAERMKSTVEECRRELRSARLECRRAWGEVARLEEENRRFASLSAKGDGGSDEELYEEEQQIVEEYRDDGDDAALPTTIYPEPEELSRTESETSVPGGRYIPDEESSFAEEEEEMVGDDAVPDAELQRQMQLLEMQYWSQQHLQHLHHQQENEYESTNVQEASPPRKSR